MHPITDEHLAAHAESKRFLLKILAAASAPTEHVNAAKEQLAITEELIERRRAAKKEEATWN